jgi:hypothetical protein
MARASSRVRADANAEANACVGKPASPACGTQSRRYKKKAARPSRRAAEILSDVISVAMDDTRRGFFTASVISLQKFDTAC